ncbi:hypothetical protein EMIT07CA2_550119 [Brevibacillus sp. IT-7CA2]|uniref:hypothetical protein n=1 Tax=Brevibacillus sp. IT-7CA2 TaxID=3026436 RepID=UPI0039DFCD99
MNKNEGKTIMIDEAHLTFPHITKESKGNETVKNIRKGDTISFEKDGILQRGTVYAVSRAWEEFYNVHSELGKAVLVFKKDLR